MSEYTPEEGPAGVDTDGDGVVDAEVHTDPGTGASVMLADLDQDGAIDTRAVDADGDGQFEAVAVDTDRDGLIDAVGTDSDADGVADTWETGDGTGAQPAPQQSPEQRAPESEPSGFAWPDPGDGATADPAQTAVERPPSAGATRLDLDEDGIEESALITDEASGVSVLVSDTDADGVIDTAFADTDADGAFDTGAVDGDDDGEVDAVGTDPDGDGEIDVWEPVDGAVEPAADGDRAAAEGQFWQQQTENGFCGPTSVAIILAEVYGVDVDAQQLVDRTIDSGWMVGSPGEWGGMAIGDTEKLMESYGVPATTITPADATEAWTLLERLTTDENYGVIAYIDSSEVWDGIEDDDVDAGLGVDHAVVVTHVDEQYVYLNDPGTPEGQQLRVDRDEFMDAWDDSGHTALVTDEPAPLPSGAGTSDRSTAVSTDDVSPPSGSDAFATGASTGAASPLGQAAADAGDPTPEPWQSSPEVDLLTAALPGLRVAILPVVLGAGALVAVAAGRRRS